MADPNQTDAGREAADDTYDPSSVEASRGRQQGLGMGQKDLDAQRDPTSDRSAEQLSFSSDGEQAAHRERDAEKKGH